MLRERRTTREQALYEILTDPIWLGEFLRTYNDFPYEPEARSKKPFSYRWYQKQILTDRSTRVSVRGGRAIGKCHPKQTYIYTYEHGYLTIAHIIRRYGLNRPFFIYAPNEQGQWSKQRAVLMKQPPEYVYRITTEAGNVIRCTGNHPVYTNEGWKLAGELKTGDTIATASYLPWHNDTELSLLTDDEVIYCGYTMRNPTTSPSFAYTLPTYHEYEELRTVLERLGSGLESAGTYTYVISNPDPIRQLLRKLDFHRPAFGITMRAIPQFILDLPLRQLRMFLSRWLSYLLQDNKLIFTDRYIGQRRVVEQAREALLRFGINTRVLLHERDRYELEVDSEAFAAFLREGYDNSNDLSSLPTEQFYYSPITSIAISQRKTTVYAVEVFGPQVYLAENMLVHNSTVIQDYVTYLVLNAKRCFSETSRDILVATPNKNQLVPILDAIRYRFARSPILSGFVSMVNLSNGTIDISFKHGTYRIYFRIAGQRGENNMVGLHVMYILIDESQLFPLDAWSYLLPALNTWEPHHQLMVMGVPNGVQENVLFLVDQRSPAWKRYHIPATESPYWLREEHEKAKQFYGGEASDDFQRMVLGEHGETMTTVLSFNDITRQAYPFHSFSFTPERRPSALVFPKLHQTFDMLVASIDCGFTDPTLIQLYGYANGVWHVLCRWRLTRIPFPDQAVFITQLASSYNLAAIGIDLGAGGGGIGIMQQLQQPSNPMSSFFKRSLYGVNFSASSESVNLAQGMQTVRVNARTAASEELVRMLQENQLVLSEIDHEGTSQLVRIAHQKKTDGTNYYFIINDQGGKSGDDHIFASFLVFVILLSSMSHVSHKVKLTSPRWVTKQHSTVKE